jgi:shikimate dehydrogenase
MLKLGLIGHHISYSKSPSIHRFMRTYLNYELTYDLLDVEPSHLSMLIDSMRKGFYHGFNVTQPYKEMMMDMVDLITPQAKKIQAINTIYIKDKKIIGDNTDYDGFLGLLKKNQIYVKDKNVYILGTGGAAKACYHVLKDLDANPFYVTRDALKKDKHTIVYQDLYHKDIDIFVQATPVGTYPNIDHSILSKDIVKDKFVIDLVYRPLETKILKDAKKGVNGLDMLIIQALKSLSLWTNQDIKLTKELHQKLKDVVINE